MPTHPRETYIYHQIAPAATTYMHSDCSLISSLPEPNLGEVRKGTREHRGGLRNHAGGGSQGEEPLPSPLPPLTPAGSQAWNRLQLGSGLGEKPVFEWIRGLPLC